MKIEHHFLNIESRDAFQIVNITQEINRLIAMSNVRNGLALITSQHTTTALTVNECEERLLNDINAFFAKLAPANEKYLHNDIHLRDCPPDEPENAHSHLAAMLLGNGETLAIVEGRLQLGTYQSVMLVELDGPRQRRVSVQLCGV